MKRREFLMVASAGLAALLLPVDAYASTPNRAPQGEASGGAAGVTRSVQAKLGAGCQLLGVYRDAKDTLYAKVTFQGLPFWLKSTDGATWYTSEWIAPIG